MRLAAHPAAVYGEDGACNVIACGRAEEERCAREVLRLPPAGGWNALEDLAVAGFVGLEGFGVGGAEVAGGDGVDLNAFWRPLIGEGFGELCDSTFAGGVGGDSDASLKTEERCDVDDLAVAAGDHVACGKLGELEGTGEVDLKYVVPVFESDFFSRGAVDGACVVDEDVDAAYCSYDLMEEMFGSAGVGEIGLEGMGFAACCVDGCGGIVGGTAVAVARYGGSSLRECGGDGGAKTAG